MHRNGGDDDEGAEDDGEQEMEQVTTLTLLADRFSGLRCVPYIYICVYIYIDIDFSTRGPSSWCPPPP